MTTDATPAAPAAASYPFQAETQQLLDLMIHSLYSNKEIFLRELISNASDALDRRRFEALSAPELGLGDAEPEIRLAVDGEKRTLSIADNGIGMSRDEAADRVRALGGTFQSSVAKDTTYLVAGGKVGGSKLKKAESYGTQIINEQQFVALLEKA